MTPIQLIPIDSQNVTDAKLRSALLGAQGSARTQIERLPAPAILEFWRRCAIYAEGNADATKAAEGSLRSPSYAPVNLDGVTNPALRSALQTFSLGCVSAASSLVQTYDYWSRIKAFAIANADQLESSITSGEIDDRKTAAEEMRQPAAGQKIPA